MSGDFFDQLDAELAELTRRGAHLSDSDRERRWRVLVVRRGVMSMLLALVLAVSLASEFPASASGQAQAVGALRARGV